MDWCSVYLTPQGLPKYIYLSPPLIFPTTYSGIRTKNRPVWITPGATPIRWMGPIRNPRWEQMRTEGYVIVVLLAVTILFLTTIFVPVADWLSLSIPRWVELETVDIGLPFKYGIRTSRDLDISVLNICDISALGTE